MLVCFLATAPPLTLVGFVMKNKNVVILPTICFISTRGGKRLAIIDILVQKCNPPVILKFLFRISLRFDSIEKVV